MARIVIFSGAGVSAESGISTFRDSDGLWERYDIKDICMAGCLQTNRKMTLDFYNQRRADLADKKPNLAHEAIAKLKNEYPSEIAVITQNVDDMFERAGCKEVLHVHGFLRHIKCEACSFIQDIAYEKQDFEAKCPECETFMRPDIVFFGEAAPMYEHMYKEMDDCEVFVTIGTSGAVINVDMLSQWANYSILNNLEYSNLINDELFSEVYYEKATTAIPKIVSSIKRHLAET